MKKHLKKIAATMLAVLMLVSVLITAVPPEGFDWAMEAEAAEFSYDTNKALTYAEEHWDDGKGLCAEFVSDCLSAGGLSSYSRSSTALKGLLLSEVGSDKWYKLSTKGNYIPLTGNEGKVATGDPIFWYCSDCKKYMHTALCNGSDEDGYLLNYAHNSAQNGKKRIWIGSCYECGNAYAGMYSVHIAGNSAPSKPPTPAVSTDAGTHTIIAAANSDGSGTSVTFNTGSYDCNINYHGLQNDSISFISVGNDTAVVLFKDSNCSGEQWLLTPGKYNLENLPALNDSISSFIVYSLEEYGESQYGKHKVVFTEDANGAGTSETFGLGNHSYFTDFQNITYDAISYISVGYDTVVVLFDNSDYTGEQWLLTPGQYNMNGNLALLNDRINSFKIFTMAEYSNSEYGNHKVVVTEHANASGLSKTFVAGKYSCLSNFDCISNDSISYLSVGSDTVVVLFDHYDYTGDTWVFTHGTHSFENSLAYINDRVSSLMVMTTDEYAMSPYCYDRVLVAQHSDATGSSRIFSSGSYSASSNFGDIENDSISYFAVGDNTVAVLFEHHDFSGERWDLSSGIHYFTGDFAHINDKISSFIVMSADEYARSEYCTHKVLVTKDKDACGTSKIFENGTYDTRTNFENIENDSISYAAVGNDTVMVLFDNYDQTGDVWTLSPGSYSFLGMCGALNDKVSSFVVLSTEEYVQSDYSTHKVVVNQEADCSGTSRVFYSGSYSCNSNYEWIENDEISNLAVGQDTVAIAFIDHEYSGERQIFLPGVYNLAENYNAWNDAISSLIVMSLEDYYNSQYYSSSDEVLSPDVTLSTASLDMLIGETEVISATINDAYITEDATVTWGSSDETVATVKDGKIVATGIGQAIISAKISVFTVHCVVNVSNPATALTISDASLELYNGEVYELLAEVTPEDTTDNIIWTSSNTNVAVVSKTGVITAVGGGTCTITVNCGSLQKSCEVKVLDSFTTAVDMDTDYFYLFKGESINIPYTVEPINTTDDIVWFSSNEAVATIEDGVLTAVCVGECTITITSGQYSYTAEVSVGIPAESLALDKTSLEIMVGESYTFSPTVTPADTTDTLFWYVDEPEGSDPVAVIDENGKLTAKRAGTTTVIAAIGDCYELCEVTVTEVDYDVTPNINGGASKLYEPWGLRYFAAFNGDDVDKIADRGIAILKDTYYTDGMTAEEFCAAENAHIYLDSEGELGFEAASTNNPNGRYYATLTEGIYSYDISAYYYVVPFAVMENGQTVYGTIKKNSMEKILNTNLNLTSITTEEKAICTCILDLKESVAAHYAASGVPGASIDMEIPRGSSQNAAASTTTTTQSGITPNIVAGASRLIEPWGLRYFATYTDSDTIADRGVVILCEKYFDSSYKTAQDKMRLNANSYVFTESDGTLPYDEASGRYYATVTEGISSKDIADVYYVVPYVVLDNGSYVYGTVKQNSMMKIMNTNLNIASVSETEKEVSRDIIALYEAVQAYYAA